MADRNPAETTGLSRRSMLKAAGGGLIAMQMLGTTIVGRAFAATPEALAPGVYKTLVQMSRDIYPHDGLADRNYAAAVDILDKAAQGTPATAGLLADGVKEIDAAANAAHGSLYGAIPDEAGRLALLQARSTTPFFQAVRSNLVVGLYDQKELWAIYGYEGEVASRGGYIVNGFDDIAWL